VNVGYSRMRLAADDMFTGDRNKYIKISTVNWVVLIYIYIYIYIYIHQPRYLQQIGNKLLLFFFVLLTAHLSIISVIVQLNAQVLFL